VLKARKRLMALDQGQILRVLTDDPAAVIDIPHFCAEQGHGLAAQNDLGHPRHEFLIRRG
jgi:tRNA 2-thiouridine synthesizing protein A